MRAVRFFAVASLLALACAGPPNAAAEPPLAPQVEQAAIAFHQEVIAITADTGQFCTCEVAVSVTMASPAQEVNALYARSLSPVADYATKKIHATEQNADLRRELSIRGRCDGRQFWRG